MSHLYSTLPTRAYTLHEFIIKSNECRRLDEDIVLHFILTGQCLLEGDQHQAVVDPTRDAAITLEDEILITRDYDSVLGVTSNIVVDSDISVYPASNPTDTLTTSIHLKYPIVKGNVNSLRTRSTHYN
jgi:hypothetical protein